MASFGIEGMSVMKKLFAVNVALLPALGLGVISSPVIAQVAESSASSDALTEIVVTAEKRDSTVLKTRQLVHHCHGNAGRLDPLGGAWTK
jgi:hypothetical protein